MNSQVRPSPPEDQGQAAQTPARTECGPKGATMTAEELDFVRAVDEYKRKNDRPFPSLREILHVLKSLGYRKAPI